MPGTEETKSFEIELSLEILEKHLQNLSPEQEERVIEMAYNVIHNQ